jgi:hypothetical protein
MDQVVLNQAKELNSVLKAIEPKHSEMSQLITYTLIGTALVGIMVYHYIKNQEALS